MASPDKLSARLKECFAEKMAIYHAILARDAAQSGDQPPAKKDAGENVFWDIVVLTATDDNQATSYSEQIRAKEEKREIPKARYHVIADPPGYKIGNGGATLHALAVLEGLYPRGTDGTSLLDTSRVFLIHAGGYSQRLPNVSVVGKIFTALPRGKPLMQMLDLKFAMYADFPSKMRPGVFVTCADDIELLDSDGELTFDQPGFTALGHPSSLEIGTTHGVFILDAASKEKAGAALADDSNKFAPCIAASCTRFIHKPNVERMQAMGAVLPNPRGGDSERELVYTDSVYSFDRATAVKLLAFHTAHAPFKCEIDAYGDFLQALGPEATDEYCCDVKNVVSVQDDLTEMRRALFHHLRGTPLNVILCNSSKFYHVGTVSEYLFHLCHDEICASELAFDKRACTDLAHDTVVAADACVMGSIVGEGVTIGGGSVVEYCRIGKGSSIGGNSIVSGVDIPASVAIPEGVFLHKTCVHAGKHVSMALGMKDNLKQGAVVDKAESSLTLFDGNFGEAIKRLGISAAQVFGGVPSGKKVTLWEARVFPVCDTAEESLTLAVSIARAARNQGPPVDLSAYELLSFVDILNVKDITTTVALRTALIDSIVQKNA